MNFMKVFFLLITNYQLCLIDSYVTEGNIRDWIRNFLNNRNQQTKVESALQDVGNLSSGVFQGSVTGPMLFLPYINDVVSLKLNLNADYQLAPVYSRQSQRRPRHTCILVSHRFICPARVSMMECRFSLQPAAIVVGVLSHRLPTAYSFAFRSQPVAG